MRVLFLGSGFLGLSVLEALVGLHRSDKIQLLGVFPWSKSKKGKSLKDEGEVKLLRYVRRQRLKMICCPGVNHFEFNQYLQALKPDVVIVACWGEILKPHLVQRPDIKLINCHPSKLPAHRGANPYVSSILAGEPETGVTFHWMGLGIDNGPIIFQKSVPIAADETGGSLRDKCCEVASAMVPRLMEKLAEEEIEDGLSQDEDQASYYPQITLADGLLQWTDQPETVLNRMRALKPWLSCYSMLQGQLLYIFHDMVAETREDVQRSYPLSITLNYPPEQIPAGTIVAKHGSMLWVQSGEPECLFRISDYQFYLGLGFLPRFISRFISKAMVRVGHRFVQAFVQGVVSQSQDASG